MRENDATILAAVIGAGPTVLIAYFLEFRFFAENNPTKSLNKVFALRMFGYFGALLNFFATILAVTALGGTSVKWYTQAAPLLFMAGLAVLMGVWFVSTVIQPLMRAGIDTKLERNFKK